MTQQITMNQQLLDFFSSLDLARGFAAQQIEKLMQCCEIVRYSPGETIIEEGEKYDTLKILFNGEVEVLSADADNKGSFAIASLEPGAHFGEKPFIDKGEAIATVRATECSTVFTLSSKNAKSSDLYQPLIENIAALQIERLHGSNLRQIQSLQEAIDRQKKQNAFGRFYILTLVVFAVGSFIPDYSEDSPLVQLLFRWLPLVLILVPTVYAAKKQDTPLSSFGLTKKGWVKSFVEGVMVAIVLMPLLILLKIFIFPVEEGIFTWKTIQHYTQGQFVFYLISYIPHAAIQEFIARGVGQGALQRFMSDTHYMKIILIASSLFAILHLHLSVQAAVFTFLLSIVFGYLYYRHQSLVGVTVLHILLGWFTIALGLI